MISINSHGYQEESTTKIEEVELPKLKPKKGNKSPWKTVEEYQEWKSLNENLEDAFDDID